MRSLEPVFIHLTIPVLSSITPSTFYYSARLKSEKSIRGKKLSCRPEKDIEYKKIKKKNAIELQKQGQKGQSREEISFLISLIASSTAPRTSGLISREISVANSPISIPITTISGRDCTCSPILNTSVIVRS